MIRDVAPKEYSVAIAGKTYNILPATLAMQNKIVHRFGTIEKKEMSFPDVWQIIFPKNDANNANGLALTHLAHCMIDFGDKEPDFEKFVAMLASKKTEPEWANKILMTWQEAMPKHYTKKKRIKKLLASLTITSAIASWLLGIWYVIGMIF